MTPFLKQVAVHYFATVPIGTRCFVFPNRRSMVFFRKYLAEAAGDPALNAAAPGNTGAVRPVLLPEMLTVNDFFQRLYDRPVTDRITLILELYEVYRSLNPRAEPLDEFVFWADVILGDFADADKYLADPKGLFTNVKEFRDIQDSMNWLTADQQAAIRSFVAHFRTPGRTDGTDADGAKAPDVKEHFLQIWNLLYPLYRGYRKRLEEKGMAYEGMVYREIAERMKRESAPDVVGKAFPRVEGFVFVGLNALNECEKTVLRKMRDAGMAEFCWDWCSPMVRDRQNRSSVFMADNVRMFPMQWEPEPENNVPEVHVISVPSSVGQAKQLPSMIAGDGSDTAVVLPDESLLMPVLNSIPLTVPDINVTMGYPLTGSGIYSLLTEAAALQMHLRERDGQVWFYHKQVWGLFSDGIVRKLTGAPGEKVIASVQSAAKYYVPQSDLTGDDAPELFRLLFRPVVRDPKSTDREQIGAIAAWQEELLRHVGPLLAESPSLAQEAEFARRCLNCVRLLRQAALPVLPQTYFRLLDRLFAGESVPYTGEPLKGMQVMGPLETRALDFSNVIILSCNEGIFPHRSVSSSFIPPELRKGFGLPTYEHQDAVWAYYFYRLIQRAKTVWLLYDSRTEKMKSGEESRYIKQLQYHFRVPLHRQTAQARIVRTEGADSIPKPADFAERLRQTWLSATALQNYLSCPAKFFYGTMERLRPETEVAESLDAGMIGNVYHNTMEALYLGEKAMDPSFDMDRDAVHASVESGALVPLRTVKDAYVAGWLRRKDDIKARIRSLIRTELKTQEVTGRNLVIEDVILQYVLKTLERDRELMREHGTVGFDILGLERACTWKFDGYTFFGYIDRLDSFEDGTVRVVDYKTGRVEDKDVRIDDGNAAQVTDLLFGEDNGKRPKIALQLFLYDMYAQQMEEAAGKRIVNVIYPAAKLFTEGEKSAEMNAEFCAMVQERLHGLLAEMADPDQDIRRTEDRGTCAYCDFKVICGR